MAVVVTTTGADYYARVILGIIGVQQYQVLLYVNLRSPAVNDTLANYTQCTWPGYSPIVLIPAEWTGSTTNGVATYQYPLVTWAFDPSNQAQQTVYGYLVIDQGGDLLYAEQFAAPYPISPQGGTLPLILQWTDEQCFA